MSRVIDIVNISNDRNAVTVDGSTHYLVIPEDGDPFVSLAHNWPEGKISFMGPVEHNIVLVEEAYRIYGLLMLA